MSRKKEVNAVEAELFRKAKFRLLHAQCGQYIAPPFSLNENWRPVPFTRELSPDSTLCGSVWKPGWGLHSSRSVVELKLKKGAKIVVWTHDGFSHTNTTSSSWVHTKISDWGDRVLGNYDWPKYFRSVTDPTKLGVTRKALKKRNVNLVTMPCGDPVNEMWFRLVDVVQLRAIEVKSTKRTDDEPNTHDIDSLRIKVAGDWVPFDPAKAMARSMKFW